jgi:hypothetical protein
MNLPLRICWRAYDLSLRLYPAKLRDAFGSEMGEIFRCQTLDAWTERGWAGLLPVVWCGAKEMLTEGVWPLASSPAVLSAATSLVFTSLTFVCLLWALENPLGVKALGDRIQRHITQSAPEYPLRQAKQT